MSSEKTMAQIFRNKVLSQTPIPLESKDWDPMINLLFEMGIPPSKAAIHLYGFLDCLHRNPKTFRDTRPNK